MEKEFQALGHDILIRPSAPGLTEGSAPIGKKEIAEAAAILAKYKQGKANLESRIVENERWYKLRHWEVIRTQARAKDPAEQRPEPASAWLFNSLANKHADAMDNYPEPNVLPREKGDLEDAAALSEIIPVILERNDFEDTYSLNWWYKLKHGTAAYGVFWDSSAENGLGDIAVKPVDLLNLFWQPGITDIQQSRNLFVVSLVDTDLLEHQYPELKGKFGAGGVDVKTYALDDEVDISDKTAVVDWYYKTTDEGGQRRLHYCKFVGAEVLYATENDPDMRDVGLYDHGQYPIVFDVLFPEAGMPTGFGYLDIMKEPQLYIDKLWQVMLENSMMAARPRYFASRTGDINEQEFLDISKPIVHVEGDLDDRKLRPIEVTPVPGAVQNILQLKIDELKETSSNRDFSQGGASGGVTAAAAIAALQEAGNKTSRDMIGASYRAYTRIDYLVIELIRQFYDESRSFRILGAGGQADFVLYSNERIKNQLVPDAGTPLYRRPVFDIQIRPQRRNPFNRMSQNELAKELYGMGFFNPELAEQSLGALELMEFEGKDAVIERVQEGQTLLNMMEGMQQEMARMAAVIEGLTGVPMGGDAQTQRQPMPHKADKRASGGSYAERIVARSTPDMSAVQGVTP